MALCLGCSGLIPSKYSCSYAFSVMSARVHGIVRHLRSLCYLRNPREIYGISSESGCRSGQNQPVASSVYRRIRRRCRSSLSVGITAAVTKQQLPAGVAGDSPKLFYKDVMKDGHNRNNPAPLKTMTGQCVAASCRKISQSSYKRRFFKVLSCRKNSSKFF